MSKIPADKRHREMIAYPLGDKILAEELHQEIGGGAVNTATAFRRMGFKTAYLGILGNDSNTQLVLDYLKKEKISFVGKIKDFKTNYSVILDSQLDDRTILVYKGASEHLIPSDIKNFDARWLYMTSLKLPTMEKLSKKAKEAGATVAFNPSSYTSKIGQKKLKKVLNNTDILIFNKEEARMLLGTREDVIHLLKRLKEIVRIPVVTDGKNGAWVLKDDIIYHTTPKKNLKIVETTGAGDAFGSGFVSGLLLMKSIPEALRLGMLNSESVIGYLGATNILLDKNHALKLLKKDKRKVDEIVLK